MSLRLPSVVAAIAVAAGCFSQPAVPTSSDTGGAADGVQVVAAASPAASPLAESADPSNGEHPHKPGAHGGIVVEIGRDSYHAEAVFETGGKLRLYMLGRDEGRVQDVEMQTLTAYVKPVSSSEATSFSLEPERQPGDAEGKTSLFVGQLPEEFAGEIVAVTVPSIRIAGERFRLGFQSAEESHGEASMPGGVSDEEERALYLTPGGEYTEADIAANGGKTASEKFRGLRAEHDLNPKPGDRLCPITLTKGHPKFTWVIGGQSYEFCCPPCVDEFVKLAKENGDIKSPDEFVKR